MRYRQLGKTGIEVSEVSFGTIPILQGDVPVLPEHFNLSNEEALSVLRYAYDLGCNLFDTAIVPEYGDAEIKLGQFANTVDRQSIVLSDKARFFTGNEMYEAVEQSINNLGTYADIYFVHQVDFSNVEMTFRKYGAIDALCELKAEGKIKFTGLASHYYDILLRGAFDKRIDVLQGSGNILERGMLERIKKEPIFQEKGFLLNKVYAAGILTRFFPPERLIAGVLNYPISSALIGLGSKEQIDVVMQKEFEDRPIDYETVLMTLKKAFEPIACDRCQNCYCINKAEIHTIFRQYNYYFLGKDYWALRKLDLNIKEQAQICKSCTEQICLEYCSQKINIPEKMQEIANLVSMHVYKGWI